MPRVVLKGYEAEFLVEIPGWLIDRFHHDGMDAQFFSQGQTSPESIDEHEPAQTFPLDRLTRKRGRESLSGHKPALVKESRDRTAAHAL